jgi:hypothetical protein
MKISQVDLANSQQVREFLELPFRIYENISQWVPPLQIDERNRLNLRRYPFFKHSSAAFYLAYQGAKTVGRIAVMDHRLYNQHNNKKTAFFYMFECEDIAEASAGLFEAAFEWAHGRNLNEILGPKGFTALDGAGLLVKGFEHRPAFGLPYNPAYYVPHIEAQNFSCYMESVSGYLGADINFPERIQKLADRIAQRRGLRVAGYKNRSDIRKLIPHLKDLYNETLGGMEDGTPITDEETRSMADQMLWFADPKLIKTVMKDDLIVGFLLAYPDLSAALQKTGGRLFPFGWLVMLLELKRTDWLNINGAGLVPEYRGSGGTAILFSEMFKSVVENGQFRHAEVVQIGKENEKMQREMQNFGIDFYKTHRVYKRAL